jgi:hypothetical protein
MKKISILICILMMSVVALAQHAPVFGVKAGVNLANWNSENENVEYDMKTGFHVGGLAHIHLSPQWALQPELQYSSQGSITDKGTSNEYKWKLDYVNVPIMVQYMFDNGFRFEAGPQVGLLVDAKQIDENDNKEDIDKDEFSTADFSLGVGLNYLTYSGFGIGARYNHGFTDINPTRQFAIKNRVFQISVFYMFDSQHKAKSR